MGTVVGSELSTKSERFIKHLQPPCKAAARFEPPWKHEGPKSFDTHDRAIIAWRTVTGGSKVRDVMPEAVESRFGTSRSPEPIEWLSENGSPCTAQDMRRFAVQRNLARCFAPVASGERDGTCRRGDA